MENSPMKLKNDHKNMTISVVDKYLRSINERMRSDSHDLKDVRLSVNLLDRFVQGESLNVVVLTLYPPSEGYTLALKIHDALENETSLIPYHEDELLNCIDNQQLPPVLVELLEEVGAQVFYDGCVFVEVKDCRENSKLSWHVLLKPTSQSVMADARQICQEHGWGSEELLQLESVLCMAVAEPLCLSPNPALGDLAINRDRVAKQMQSTVLQRTRRNLIANGTKRKSEPTSPSELRLYEFLRKKSRLGRTIPPILKAKDDTRSSSSPPPQLDVADVLRLAKPLERPKETTDCSTVTCEEYLYETDRVNGRVNLVRLTILQRPATEEFLGQLYVDRDFKEGTVGTVNGAGASCMFSLGSRLNVNRYIQQFTEIFTEEGRKSVKITHQVQNQPPRVMYTQSMREKERLREKEAAAALQLQQQQQASEAAASTVEPETPAPTVVPAVAEPVAPVAAPLTKTALIESLKSGQVTPAIATLVSNLLSSAQQTQIRSQGATGVHLLTNGQQQSLLRPSAAGVGVRAATGSVQNIQLITQTLPVHQGQAQVRPNIRPTALAALLTTKAATGAPAGATPVGKGKVIPGAGAQGQVIRPATGSPASISTPILPSYSQAISQTTTGGTIVRAIRPSASAPAAGTVMGTIRRPSDGLTPSNGPAVGQRFSLTTLLAGTPSADSPGSNGSNSAASGSNNSGSAVSLPSLLERLQQQSPGKLQPAAGATVVPLNNNNNNIAPGAKLTVNSNHNNNLNVQSINLAGLQGAVASLPLQSIQVSIPGIATPFSLSVAVTSSSTQASTVSTPSVMGSVRLATAVNAASGQPISIPLSVLQIPSSGGPVQLIGSVAKGGGAAMGASGSSATAVASQRPQTANSTNNAQMASGTANPSSGSLLAQQQLQMALQRQAASVQIQLQQKMTAKQQQQQQQPKPKPQHNS